MLLTEFLVHYLCPILCLSLLTSGLVMLGGIFLGRNPSFLKVFLLLLVFWTAETICSRNSQILTLDEKYQRASQEER